MTNVDTVRLLIGDNDSSDQVISDSDITSLLDERSIVDSSGSTTGVNVVAAAADAAAAIAAKYARQFSFAEDGQSFDRAQRYSHYLALEQDLRKRQGGYSQPLRLAGTATS